MNIHQKGFANIVVIILAVVLAGALGYVTLVKKPAAPEQPTTSQNTPPPVVNNNTTPQNPPPSEIANLKTYKNDTYGFEFKYPTGVTIESGVKEFFFFHFKTPIITVKDSAGKVVFAIGTTGYFKFDSGKQKYVLQALVDSITLQESCTKPFFDSSSIRAAEISWGEGGDWTILHNIFTSHNIGLGIAMNRFDPALEEARGLPEDEVKKLKQSLDTRIALEKQILQTLTFIGNTSSIDFTCKNWSR